MAELPRTIDDVRAIYHPNAALPRITRDTAEASRAVLEQAGYTRIATSVDCAPHDEDAYPLVGALASNHPSPHLLEAQGAVVGPCFLDPSRPGEAPQDVFMPQGIAFWLPAVAAAS